MRICQIVEPDGVAAASGEGRGRAACAHIRCARPWLGWTGPRRPSSPVGTCAHQAQLPPAARLGAVDLVRLRTRCLVFYRSLFPSPSPSRARARDLDDHRDRSLCRDFSQGYSHGRRHHSSEPGSGSTRPAMHRFGHRSAGTPGHRRDHGKSLVAPRDTHTGRLAAGVALPPSASPLRRSLGLAPSAPWRPSPPQTLHRTPPSSSRRPSTLRARTTHATFT